ncbi:hypothetical protein US8_01832 [Bacillus altitudinis]|nr:hypothetical protein US8_01832 [Bacillus altitudinis]
MEKAHFMLFFLSDPSLSTKRGSRMSAATLCSFFIIHHLSIIGSWNLL